MVGKRAADTELNLTADTPLELIGLKDLEFHTPVVGDTRYLD